MCKRYRASERPGGFRLSQADSLPLVIRWTAPGKKRVSAPRGQTVALDLRFVRLSFGPPTPRPFARLALTSVSLLRLVGLFGTIATHVDRAAGASLALRECLY
jgi:hypothetical protein